MKHTIFLLLILIFQLLPSQKKWSLEECINYAHKNNLQIKSYELNKITQEYNLESAQNEFLPTVNANVFNNINFGQTQGFQGSIGRNDNFSNNFNLSANILLYNGGRLEKQQLKKRYDVEVAQHNLELIKRNISLQIIQQYLSILLRKELLKVHQNAVEHAKKKLSKSQNYYRSRNYCPNHFGRGSI